MAVPLSPEHVRRIRSVFLGWVGACLTALPLGFLGIVMIVGPPRYLSDFAFLLTFAPILTLAISAPALLLAIIADHLRMRRPLWYAAAGIIAVALAMVVVLGIMPTEHHHRAWTEAIPLRQRITVLMTLFVVAAPVGGLAGYIYWRIAIKDGEVAPIQV